MEFKLDYLYPGKASILKERYNIFKSNKGSLKIITVKDATIIPPSNNNIYDCFVLDKAKNVVDLSSFDPIEGYTSEELNNITKNANKDDQRVYFAGYFNSHWGHFLMETITRLWPLFSSNADFDCKVVYCIQKNENPDLSGNIGKVLQLLGILDKIIFISTPTIFREVIRDIQKIPN